MERMGAGESSEGRELGSDGLAMALMEVEMMADNIANYRRALQVAGVGGGKPDAKGGQEGSGPRKPWPGSMEGGKAVAQEAWGRRLDPTKIEKKSKQVLVPCSRDTTQ